MQKEQKKETTVERETRIRTLWAQEGTFAKSVSNRAEQRPLYFMRDPQQRMVYHMLAMHLVEP